VEEKEGSAPGGTVFDAGLLDRFLGTLGQVPPDRADLLGLLRDQTEAGRRKARRLLTDAVANTMAEHPAAQRLALLTAVLLAMQAGTWDDPFGEQGWIRVVCAALEGLDRDDIPDRLSPQVASWAALATYLMHEHRPVTGRVAETLSYEKAARAVSHLFPDADARLVADYAGPITNKNGSPVDPDAVLYVIEVIVQDDPLATAIDALDATHPDWRVHKHNDVLLHVDGSFRNTFLPAAEAVDAIPDTARPVAVYATGAAAGWTIAIRCDGTLIHVERSPHGGITWQQYRLGSLTTPTGLARDPERRNRARVSHGRQDQHFPAAVEALTVTGFGLSDPPTDCPPA
jgi:hypothetical protein